jgi:hypothetical protein
MIQQPAPVSGDGSFTFYYKPRLTGCSKQKGGLVYKRGWSETKVVKFEFEPMMYKSMIEEKKLEERTQ